MKKRYHFFGVRIIHWRAHQAHDDVVGRFEKRHEGRGGKDKA